jgi:hypothetical protein
LPLSIFKIFKKHVVLELAERVCALAKHYGYEHETPEFYVEQLGQLALDRLLDDSTGDAHLGVLLELAIDSVPGFGITHDSRRVGRPEASGNAALFVAIQELREKLGSRFTVRGACEILQKQRSGRWYRIPARSLDARYRRFRKKLE